MPEEQRVQTYKKVDAEKGSYVHVSENEANIPKLSPSNKTRNAPCTNADSAGKLPADTLIKDTQDNRSLTVRILPVCKRLNHCKEKYR